jgi:hypothetical protein
MIPCIFETDYDVEVRPARWLFLRSKSDADGRDPAARRREDKFEILHGGTLRFGANLAQRHHAPIDFEPKPMNRLPERFKDRQLMNSRTFSL